MGEAFHEFFGLTYAQYLVLPRSVLDETIDWRTRDGLHYAVSLREDDTGKIVSIIEDPLMDYERGRRQIPHREEPRLCCNRPHEVE